MFGHFGVVNWSVGVGIRRRLSAGGDKPTPSVARCRHAATAKHWRPKTTNAHRTHLLMFRGGEDWTEAGDGLLAPARGGGGMRTAGGFRSGAAGVVAAAAAAFLFEEKAFIDSAGRLWKPSTTTTVQPAVMASTRRGRRRGAILLVWSAERRVLLLVACVDGP